MMYNQTVTRPQNMIHPKNHLQEMPMIMKCNQTVQMPQKMVHQKNPQKTMENAQVRILLENFVKSSSFGSPKRLKQYKSN